jgi:hypothetical protein
MKGKTNLLEEDRYIFEQAEVVLVKATVKIGVISSHTPTWLWHIGTIGQVQWTQSPVRPIGGSDLDPPWIDASICEQPLSRIEALIIQGSWPPIEDSVWKIDTLTVAVRIRMKQRRRRKKLKISRPEGWKETHSYSILHHEVGGVTNGEFQVEIWTKNCIHGIVPVTPPNVTGNLGEALDGLENGREVDPPHNGDTNSSEGILNRSNRSGEIHTRTVFRPGRGVIRKMTVREKGRVLDFPDTRTIRMTNDELSILIEDEVNTRKSHNGKCVLLDGMVKGRPK